MRSEGECHIRNQGEGSSRHRAWIPAFIRGLGLPIIGSLKKSKSAYTQAAPGSYFRILKSDLFPANFLIFNNIAWDDFGLFNAPHDKISPVRPVGGGP
jgi:hypothetical protein